MNNINGKLKTAERLAVLETKIDEIKSDIRDIKENHLSHIYEKLEALNDFKIRVTVYGAVGAFIGSIVIQLLINYLKYFLK